MMLDYNKKEIEASVFRRLVAHLQENTEVQNIDLMDLAGFCRNCLGKWYKAAAEENGVDMDYDAAREIIYGMPYVEWKDKYQK
tara:strand:+ start:1263 stop:1511 length:249 start_codon:yes stop_codon:yes gene_type:complete